MQKLEAVQVKAVCGGVTAWPSQDPRRRPVPTFKPVCPIDP